MRAPPAPAAQSTAAPVAMQPSSAPVAARTMAAPKAIQQMGIAPVIKPPSSNIPMPQTRLASPSAASQMLPAVQSGSPATAMPTPQISSQAMGGGLRKNGSMQVHDSAPVSKSEITAIKAKAVRAGLKCTADGPASILSISDDTTQNMLVSGSTINNDRLSILGCHFGKTGVAGLVMSSDPGKAMLLTQRPYSWIGDMNGDGTGWSAITIYGTNFPFGKPGEKSGPWRLKIAIDNGATLTSSQAVYFVNECKDSLVGCQ